MGEAADRLKTEFGIEPSSDRPDRSSSSVIEVSQDSCADYDQAQDCAKVAQLAEQISEAKEEVAKLIA